MNKRGEHIGKCVLMGVLFLVLSLPLLQHLFAYFETRPLDGYQKEVEYPQFGTEQWFDGDFQSDADAYLNVHFGFRNTLVRAYNEFYFKVFHYSQTQGVVIGKDNYLFEENYINAHLGRDYLGEEEIAQKVEKLSFIRDALAKENVELVVVFAPGKGSFCSDFIPDEYEPWDKQITNYEVYRDKLKSTSIPFVDFHRWFDQMKDTTAYPLFSPTGIHWSRYGELLVADSLLSYLSVLREEQLVDLEFTGMRTSKVLEFTDDDAERGMNLMCDIPDLEMAYPDILWKADSNTVKPNAIVVGDSYYWGLFNSGFSYQAFSNGQFWYYNQDIYNNWEQGSKSKSEIDVRSNLINSDIVILLCTDANLYKFAFGFIDENYELLAEKKD
ncbi:MAG: hypothetical protein NWR73_00090 [Flavobacteriales bacterium]|nr:hypothetical protein [Flavobacteriales bacterium]